MGSNGSGTSAPSILHQSPPIKGSDTASPSPWMGVPQHGGGYWGEGTHLHVEIPAPTKQMTLRPGGEEFLHHMTVRSAPK